MAAGTTVANHVLHRQYVACRNKNRYLDDDVLASVATDIDCEDFCGISARKNKSLEQ